MAAAIALAGGVAHHLWKRGTAYQAAVWSPNHRYYVQKFSTASWTGFVPAMPGHGSDAIDGYIRLFDGDGHLLHERFETFIRDIEPVWAGRQVYLMGVPAMDDDPWLLPSAAD